MVEAPRLSVKIGTREGASSFEIFKDKQLMEITKKKVPTTFEKVGAKVKRIVEAKNKPSKFVSKCMEIIKLEDEMDYFIGQPDDEATWEYLLDRFHKNRYLGF